MSMLKYSNHIIALANEHSNGVTNLELHKVMYFAIGTYIKVIYDEPFEAWPYGPVIRSVYFEHKLNGRSKIKSNSEYDNFYEPLNDYILQFLDKPIRELVEESHEHPIWKSNKSKIIEHDLVEYKLEDIQDAFIQ